MGREIIVWDTPVDEFLICPDCNGKLEKDRDGVFACETCGEFVVSIRIEDAYDIEDEYEKLAEKISKQLARKLRHADLPVELLLGSDYSSLNPFEALSVFLRSYSFSDVMEGRLWAEYLEVEIKECIEQCSDVEKQILEHYQNISETMYIEDELLDNFCHYCTCYENKRIERALDRW